MIDRFAILRLFQTYVSEIAYKDWEVEVVWTKTNFYLQVSFAAPSNVTGEVMPWKGRKWLLSEHMTQSEVILTALKAVLTAEEHEAREQFLFRGRAIFDPHTDVETLWIAAEAEKDVRK